VTDGPALRKLWEAMLTERSLDADARARLLGQCPVLFDLDLPSLIGRYATVALGAPLFLLTHCISVYRMLSSNQSEAAVQLAAMTTQSTHGAALVTACVQAGLAGALLKHAQYETIRGPGHHTGHRPGKVTHTHTPAAQRCRELAFANLGATVYDAVDRSGRYGDLLGTQWFVALAERLAQQGTVEGIVAYLVDTGRCVV
jgi:hypothetical protein